jgi:hypothetical protein
VRAIQRFSIAFTTAIDLADLVQKCQKKPGAFKRQFREDRIGADDLIDKIAASFGGGHDERKIQKSDRFAFGEFIGHLNGNGFLMMVALALNEKILAKEIADQMSGSGNVDVALGGDGQLSLLQVGDFDHGRASGDEVSVGARFKTMGKGHGWHGKDSYIFHGGS